MSYEVLARKYRPSNFDQVIGQEHIVEALANGINQKRLHQAYIFSGTRGVGKTTLARILAKCLNCEATDYPSSNPCNECTNCSEIRIGRSVDFLEIDAASNTQVEKMRDLIETVEYKPAKGRYKVYLIDEVHMLSTASFNALLKTLEEPPSHVVFIFATTNPEKIPKTVQSRCLQLNLKTVNESILIDHIKSILKTEKIKFDDISVSLIANSAKGSVRDGLTLLDQAIAHGDGELNETKVKKLLGTIDDYLLFALIDSLIEGNGKATFDILSKIEELSPAYNLILRDIISILHKVSLQQFLGNSNSKAIGQLADKTDKEFCQLLYEIAMNAYAKFSVHPNPKEALEICLLRMLTFNPLQKLSEANEEKKNIPEKKNLKTEYRQPEDQVKEKYSSDNHTNNDSSKSDIELKNNSDWIRFFESMSISPFARNYYGNMSFLSYKNHELSLNIEDSVGDVPEKIEIEFTSALKSMLAENITIKYKIGKVTDSPIEIQSKLKQESLDEAQSNIKNDESIQKFVKKFKGSIKDDSIRPVK